MALWTLSGTTRVSSYQKVHFAIFWIFWSKMKITQADAPTVWMDCHPIQTNWSPPPLPSPPFLCRMPFLTQPSQFILAWDRHQICWLAYPVAWFAYLVAWLSKVYKMKQNDKLITHNHYQSLLDKIRKHSMVIKKLKVYKHCNF